MSGLRAEEAQLERVIVLWFPDWPVYAVGRELGWDVLAPAAIISEHKVLACNVAARQAGVRVGMKQRHALATCPQLLVAPDNPVRQAAVHEDVVSALAEVAAGVETLRPGLVAMAAGPLARFYGSEERAVELLLDTAVRMEADCLAGVADGLVTATWAARAGKSIPAGRSAEFLARLPISSLVSEPALNGPRELVGVLSQLGVRTLRDFCALSRTDVAGRFGQEAVEWHRLAAGQPGREVAPRRVEDPLEVRHELEEPVTNAETAAFVARQAAAKLHTALFQAGDACLRLSVRAHVQPPEPNSEPQVVERSWRCREPLSEEETTQRVRWQLDGWISRLRQKAAPTGEFGEEAESFSSGEAGITAIELVPVETVPAGTVVAPLWGGPDDGIRAARAAAGRAQALIGTQGVLRAIHRGGRAVAGRVVMVAYGDQDPEHVEAMRTREWVGQLVAPLPAVVGPPQGGAAVRSLPGAHPAARVELQGADGEAIEVNGRGLMSAQPATLCWGARRYRVTGWAGPWPVDENWWAEGRRYARLQVSTDEPAAYLLVCKGSRWRIEATY